MKAFPTFLLKRGGDDRAASAKITEVADNVFFVEGPGSNWTIIRDGEEFTLIDSGYPGDAHRLIESIRTVGLQPRRAAAMLITHAHSDHIGSAKHFNTAFGTPIVASRMELPHLAGEERLRVSVPQVLREAGGRRAISWLAHAIQLGGLEKNDVQQAEVWDAGRLAELPGAPVAVPTPGHTPGHLAYILPAAGAVATGDSVVTGHAVSTQEGVQLLHPMFHHRPELVPVTLSALKGVEASIILPGHGPAVRGNVSEMISALAQ